MESIKLLIELGKMKAFFVSLSLQWYKPLLFQAAPRRLYQKQ
ncbi:hypothetical protein DB44_ER00480 [Candidatus Protochlamydia amoebophila]|uniref:Uncharacterized protein n=1 Tax=Candidatus Protochlamydia amoebophila TaxID=362787 RepID=A0A0C1H032_9BACT|nr:hypothetical protein DB44_ER00480 [Candidatus Protochlamydia amoebophila]